ncbi:MAG: hypothetical protein ACRYGM_15130 [Janthinobacterium lividum]
MSDTTSPAAESLAKSELRFGKPRPKVEPFARYRGTSVWRQYRNRVREYNAYRAAQKNAAQKNAAPHNDGQA